MGSEVGRNVGYPDGLSDGTSLGNILGLIDGDSVGIAVLGIEEVSSEGKMLD